MSDRLDARVRSFVVELLDYPPESPPFPHPGVVVITGDRSQRRERMIDTKTRQDHESKQRKRMHGPAIAAGAFAAIVIVALGVFALTRAGDDRAPAAGTVADDAGQSVESLADPEVVIDIQEPAASLPGRAWNAVDSVSGPDSIEFDEGGTYRVIDQFRTVDTGVYTAEGDIVTFESDPTDEVLWVYNDMFLRTPRSCEGLVGEYRLVVAEPGRVKLQAVWDECEPRITFGNGLQLEPVAP